MGRPLPLSRPGLGAAAARWGAAPEATGRLLDAAIGIVGAVRAFVDVADDVLQERRARLGDTSMPGEPFVRSAQDGRPPTPRHDDGGAVRDIPMTGA